MKDSCWIEFYDLSVPQGFKTRRWHVRAKKNAGVLGFVGWFSRWRQYAFFPAGETVFERQCLRDIADFCETKTREHRSLKADR